MNQIVEFFSGLFDTSKWPPRWYCGEWSDFHGWLYIIGDITIWIAYMCIPLILIRFINKKEGVPLPKVFMLFGAFILLCGFTHLIDALIFWEPFYRFAALVKILTAFVSVATVIALIKYFDEAIGLKTSKEFGFELAYRKQIMTDLERSNKDLQDFAYVASHDLQAPIKTISSYLNFLSTRYTDSLDERGQKMIATTINASERMQELINDLLEFSKVGQNRAYTELDLNLLIKSIIADVQSSVSNKDVAINYSKLPTIKADKTDMRRIFSNLIENGIKYQAEGNKPNIEIEFIEKNTFYEFAIKDNGIGIEDKDKEKVFQVFQRLHSRDDYEGTGIGLAIVAKVIENYNGKISIEDNTGGGSVFKFTIPKEVKKALN